MKTKDSKRETFKLRKIKFLDNGAVNVIFDETTSEKDGTYTVTHDIKHPGHRHPDMDKILERFKQPLLVNYHISTGLNALKTQMKSEDVFGRKLVESMIDKIIKAEAKGIQIIGVTFTGADDMRGCVISAKIDGLSGKSAMNTSNILLERNTHGFEQDVETALEELEDEAFEYVFNRKRSQLELAFDDALADVEKADAPKETKGKEKKEATKKQPLKKDVKKSESKEVEKIAQPRVGGKFASHNLTGVQASA